ncbi:NAD(P)H quinone oxidoreductase, PIG3 family [Beutenbergia cavernae DSM 12333]|uniref:NAD(P)H quinone oxidoreductase, PIG3 family n=1 Tax=Beutenbergia cavernae (strain ATCC BAA-8 / DSM 12333 / CCUG 43141 / JCM 11478 / NBRC 16432 / NCIMB 13614 / HKI 0122) TaxID=471853 RepID=C5BWK3_BEUC1|nr:NAD(P)H-quinone oxidoreductase [Beutenbergia cavernae]ACQ78661.1 NAD(P)H quinone oxidoreductase, PIG3 family [Beutenbergia cavernae DSM 12333]
MTIDDGRLVPTDVPRPEPRPGQVLLDVVAAGVNRPDLLQVAGGYPPPPGAPVWPGLEVSGHVAAVGDGVTSLRTGDAVVALLDGGGYAEQAVVAAGQVLPAPDGVSLVDAAGLPETVCTVWSMMVRAARLRAGETVLVHGGSGGIGTTAILVAKALGARVITTAGGPDRTARCRDLGADVAIDHRPGDVVERVEDASDGRGVDVILDLLGGGALADNVRLLATDGRLAVIGTQAGSRGELDVWQLMKRRASVHAATLRARPPAEKAAIVADVGTHVWPMVAAGLVRPVVDRVLPLREAAQAHALLDAGAIFGKVLLATGSGSAGGAA